MVSKRVAGTAYSAVFGLSEKAVCRIKCSGNVLSVTWWNNFHLKSGKPPK